MDTAKVEIRKLQVLCDRVNSMIDALNQVRQSVHGLVTSNSSINGTFTSPLGPTWTGAWQNTSGWPNTWQANAPWQTTSVPPPMWQAGNPWQTNGFWQVHVPQWQVWQTPATGSQGLAHSMPWPWPSQAAWMPGAVAPTNARIYAGPNPYLAGTTPYAQAPSELPFDTPLGTRIATSFPFAFVNGTPRNGQ